MRRLGLPLIAVALVALVLAFTFVMTSFPVLNSDFFLEIASGRLLAQGQLRAAEIELKNAVKAAPDGPEGARLRLKLADLEIQMNDIEGAQIELKNAREHGGDEAKIVPMLGRTYLVQGKFDQVLQDFPVRDDQPDNVKVSTLVLRAEAQIQMKKVEDARSSLIAAEQIDPKATAPKLGLARIAFTLNQFDDAAKKADELLKIPYAFRLSRATLRNIRANIGFSIVLKGAFLILAIAGAATLWMAVAADMGASLIVIANALRLLRE